MAAMSGGLITNRCAKNAIDNDIANKPPDSSEGAAARIKKDEADAKARRDAVRFLGTVDCNYWPEATEALVLSLRKDPNECVRFEAALSLGNGCCCNEKTIYALQLSITMCDKDGAPPERSDRVRAAAADALARCPMLQKELELKEKDGDIKKTEAVNPGEFYKRTGQASREQIIASARGVLLSLQQANKAGAAAPNAVAPITPRANSMSALFSHALSANAGTGSPTGTMASTSMAVSSPRQPFFSGLTRALTGRQDAGFLVQSDNVPLTRSESPPARSTTGTVGFVEIVPLP
jgi:hypothetical protein